MLYESNVKEVYNLSRNGPASDAIGIEVEMELPDRVDLSFLRETAPDWTVKNDGSLRNFGVEFVSGPLSPYKDGEKLYGEWEKTVSHAALATRDNDCPRASVHVHVNVRDYTYNQLMNIITAYTLLEGVLVAYCGKYRFGNLFALRIPEASANFSRLIEKVRKYTMLSLNSENRYGALNMVSLARFGTLEFRSLGSVYDTESIKLWSMGLRFMCDHAARQYRNPPDVYRRYTEASRRDFIAEFLGELGEAILKKPLDIDALFEDGEEYAIQLLASHPDNWTYESDFRKDKGVLAYIKEHYGYNKAQMLGLNSDQAKSFRVAMAEPRIDQSLADFSSWTPAADPDAPTQSDSTRSRVMWNGEIPREHFTSANAYDLYRTYLQNTRVERTNEIFAGTGNLTQAFENEWVRATVEARRAPERPRSQSVTFSQALLSGDIAGGVIPDSWSAAPAPALTSGGFRIPRRRTRTDPPNGGSSGTNEL